MTLKLRSRSRLAGLLTTVYLGTAFCLFAPAASAQITFGNASVWDSTLAGPPTNPTFLPIGGSGQINGEFTLDTVDLGGSAIQVGLRGQERFQGPTLTRVGKTYFADPGESTPDNALWNYDWHLDFGTSFLAGQLLPTSRAPRPSGGDVDAVAGRGTAGLMPLNLRDFTVTFDFDTDPGPGASFVTTDFNALLDSFSVGPDVTLFQSSQNIGFGGLGGPLDPNTPGFYDFRLTVAGMNGTVAQSEIRVVVGGAAACAAPSFVTVGEPGTTGIVISGTPLCVYTVQVTGLQTSAVVATFDIPVGAGGTGTDMGFLLFADSRLDVGQLGLPAVDDTVILPPASILAIPTLGEWGMILLTLLLAGVGVGWISRMG